MVFVTLEHLAFQGSIRHGTEIAVPGFRRHDPLMVMCQCVLIGALLLGLPLMLFILMGEISKVLRRVLVVQPKVSKEILLYFV